jgi:hypothetical protein
MDELKLHEFLDWVDEAKPGASVVYAEAVTLGDNKTPDHVKQVGHAALRAFADGKVELCQRRNGEAFEYLAVKRKDTKPRMANGQPFQCRIETWRDYQRREIDRRHR